MSYQLPESITFADAEDIVCDFVDQQLTGVTPEIRAYTYLPNLTKSDLDDGKCFVLVQRVGGIANYTQRAAVDNAIIEITVIATSRKDSWQIMSYLRQRFYELSTGGSVSDRRITDIKETSGPSESMFADPTQRAVKFLIQVGIRRTMR